MKELIISGGSDDLIEVDGCLSEEFGAYDGAQDGLGEVIDLCVAGKPVACVHCFYDGCWFFGLGGGWWWGGVGTARGTSRPTR